VISPWYQVPQTQNLKLRGEFAHQWGGSQGIEINAKERRREAESRPGGQPMWT
jgi:hypothetical protein